MTKAQYDNPLRRQCFDLPNMIPVQFRNSLESVSGLLDTIPSERMNKIKKILVTGCGDSWLAAVEAKPAFKKYLRGTGVTMEPLRAIDAARYHNFASDSSDTMVVAISASGNTARIVEIVSRARKYGAISLALTNAPGAVAAQAAEYVYLTQTPEFPDKMPGLRSYVASLLSLLVMAAVLGEYYSKKTGMVTELHDQLLAYNNEFASKLKAVDDTAYDVAGKWQDQKSFEIIADGPLFATGEFVAAKYAEISGDLCTVIDSENYMHVNSMIMPKEAYSSLIMVFSDEDNLSRVKKTTEVAVNRDHRPVYLVSDQTPEQLEIDAVVDYSVIPVPAKDLRFLASLYAFIPGSLVASYHSALIEEPYFRGGGKFFDPTINTLKTNPIVVL